MSDEDQEWENLNRKLHESAVRGAQPKDEGEEDLGKCASRASTKWWSGLIVKNLPKEVRGFQYCHMGFEDYSPDGTWFVFVFNIPEKWRLKVWGRNLERIFRCIHQHRLEWIEKAIRDFAEDGEAIITDIEIKEIKEGEPERG